MMNLLKRAPARFKKSFGYCWDGIKDTFVKEESFRLETIAFFVLLFALLTAQVCTSWPTWKTLVMLASYLFIPLTEILNSAIENLCDFATREHAELIKNAKDKGALAVLFTIVLNALVLVALILM